MPPSPMVPHHRPNRMPTILLLPDQAMCMFQAGPKGQVHLEHYFEQINQGLLFHRGDESATTLQPGSLGYYMRNSSALGFSSADPGWFVIPKWFDPCRTSHGGTGDERMDLHVTPRVLIILH